ncbi:LysR family transcriptional regulator [Kitasatospora sp. NBC_01250]|uniref:LysR family transcriptional regulator n=1 Tax=Kitasatospora sp. NBC_01250 TaxID=2903571 RepID=UPI002E375BA1|nr:LysR family transcriptional regulator [Kitasatospora sp. NBC_01250]
MDLAEIETFLMLCEELHFGRTAERRHLSQSRVSQQIRSLERRIGAPLFTRTSRQVALTPLGEHTRRGLAAAHEALRTAFEQARSLAQGVVGTLRVGFLGCLNGPPLTDVVAGFARRHPACDIATVEVSWADPYGPLRAGEVDLVLTLLPVAEADLTVGPVLVSYDRVLAVGSGHPLARRRGIDVEDLAGQVLLDGPAELPQALRLYLFPPFTPLGRPLVREAGGQTYQEAFNQVAAGAMVWATHQGLFRLYQHPGVVRRPLSGMAPANGALIWRSDTESAKIRAFALLAEQLAAGGPPPSHGR